MAVGLAGGIASMAGSILSGITGGIFASKLAKKQNEYLDKKEKEWNEWYARNYNADEMKSATAQSLMNRTSQELKKLGDAAAGRGMVSGDVGGELARYYETAKDTLGDTAGQITANKDQKQQNVENMFQQAKSNLDDQRMNITAQRMGTLGNTITNTMTNFSKGIGSMVDSYSTKSAS